ncbi:MAG TPA: helix-turn-helix domain-containing protein [Solirubrobacteraceae bacterium]|nr:helix-turn-helix domain-containing protein [Solirubrobacteraceae bacterium]
MTPPTARSTAAKRRTELLAAAISEFAVGGLHGTSTEAIAQRAGISHAYLFRLFGTKKQLFIACCERCFERTLETFVAAAAGATPNERLESMGRAYSEMLTDRELLLSQMQLYAACADPEIRDVARRGFQLLRSEVGRLSGSTGAELYRFFARGMLINVAASMDFPDLSDPDCW